MTKVSKNLAIAGCIVCIVVSFMVSLYSILVIFGFAGLIGGVVTATSLPMVIALEVASFVFPVTILVLICNKNAGPKRIFSAGICELICAGFALLSFIFSFDYMSLFNLIWIGLMIASGVMILLEKYKKN